MGTYSNNDTTLFQFTLYHKLCHYSFQWEHLTSKNVMRVACWNRVMDSRLWVILYWQDCVIAEQMVSSMLVVCNISTWNRSHLTQLCHTRPRNFQWLKTVQCFLESALVTRVVSYASRVLLEDTQLTCSLCPQRSKIMEQAIGGAQDFKCQEPRRSLWADRAEAQGWSEQLGCVGVRWN